MQEIPPAKDTDAEDVAWGLQTAASLWKRGERGDALVWLRRAAQAAGDAEDDDRALELARAAAELADAMSAGLSLSQAPPPEASPSQAPRGAASSSQRPFVVASQPPLGPALLPLPSASRPPPRAASNQPPPAPISSFPAALRFPPSERPMPPASLPPSAPTVPAALPSYPPPEAEEEEPPSEHTASVPPAEKVHAGMFNPWDEAGAPSAEVPPPAAALPSGIPSPRFEGDEVITSVGGSTAPSAPSREPPPLVTPRSAPPKPPPPLPARAMPAPPPPRSAPFAQASPLLTPVPMPMPSAPPPPPVTPPPPSPTQVTRPSDRVTRTDPDEQLAVVASEKLTLDLEGVESFADLPDDARMAFAAAAKVNRLVESDEVSHFALAYVLEGSFDVAATMVDAAAARLGQGAVLRARGTTDEGVPMRLVCVGSSGVVATWSDEAVDEAFRTCPWVEDDLRAAADRMLTLVGITIGPLGERLDASIREQIVARLTMRPLAPGEIIVKQGDAVPGILLVGVGDLELVEGDVVTGVVSSGEFVFAGEVLGAGAAPSTARAGAGGALILVGDRAIAQELLVTCPPLLEVFAGM